MRRAAGRTSSSSGFAAAEQVRQIIHKMEKNILTISSAVVATVATLASRGVEASAYNRAAPVLDSDEYENIDGRPALPPRVPVQTTVELDRFGNVIEHRHVMPAPPLPPKPQQHVQKAPNRREVVHHYHTTGPQAQPAPRRGRYQQQYDDVMQFEERPGAVARAGAGGASPSSDADRLRSLLLFHALQDPRCSDEKKKMFMILLASGGGLSRDQLQSCLISETVKNNFTLKELEMIFALSAMENKPLDPVVRDGILLRYLQQSGKKNSSLNRDENLYRRLFLEDVSPLEEWIRQRPLILPEDRSATWRVSTLERAVIAAYTVRNKKLLNPLICIMPKYGLFDEDLRGVLLAVQTECLSRKSSELVETLYDLGNYLASRGASRRQLEIVDDLRFYLTCDKRYRKDDLRKGRDYLSALLGPTEKSVLAVVRELREQRDAAETRRREAYEELRRMKEGQVRRVEDLRLEDFLQKLEELRMLEELRRNNRVRGRGL